MPDGPGMARTRCSKPSKSTFTRTGALAEAASGFSAFSDLSAFSGFSVVVSAFLVSGLACLAGASTPGVSSGFSFSSSLSGRNRAGPSLARTPT